MNVCFFGIGGVGGYFGALFANYYKNKHNIYFIARGEHLEAVKQNGLTLKYSKKEQYIKVIPDLCTSDIKVLPLCDLIILSVKSYDLDEAVCSLGNIVHSGTIILPLLNGVDVTERIRKHLKSGIVLPACVYVSTHIESPGVIFQNGGDGRIMMGLDPLHSDQKTDFLIDLLTCSGIDIELDKNIYSSIWMKFIFIASFGLVCANYNKTLGESLENKELSFYIKSIMQELKSIAGRLNILLPEDVVEISFQKAKQFPFQTKTSFQRDIELKGKANEGDLFGGTIIRLGKQVHIPTPYALMIYTQLQDKLTK